MASLIMANMNTLIRKGYLLAGVIIAANMFIVNEVKASNTQPETENDTKENKDPNNINIDLKLINEKETGEIKTGEQKNGDVPRTSIFGKVLSHENIINLFGGLAFSCVNNYFKWWNYNAGTYREIGCFGWRTKRFLNDYLQFEVNLNVYRGLGWMLLYFLDPLITKLLGKGNKEMVMRRPLKEKTTKKIKDFIFNCAPGFISMPLTLHIFNISIAISIDSMLWELVGMANNRWEKNKNSDLEEGKVKKGDLLNDKDIENKKEEGDNQ